MASVLGIIWRAHAKERRTRGGSNARSRAYVRDTEKINIAGVFASSSSTGCYFEAEPLVVHIPPESFPATQRPVCRRGDGWMESTTS